MSFPIGSKVRCVNNEARRFELTVGKVYEVLDADKLGITIECNTGEKLDFIAERFELAESSKVIENEQVYMFDVDDTLIVWGKNIHTSHPDRIEIKDPYDGATVHVVPHERHVKLLTQMKGRGRFIIVWSQSGAKWAQAVVEALGLTDSVDLILTKPQGYVDDLPVSKWMKNHIYIKGAE